MLCLLSIVARNIPKMSCFLAILRCIIGVDDNQEEETRLRNSNRYNSPYYDTPSRGYVPPTTTTTTTNATTYGQIREPSGAYRTTPSSAYGTTSSSAYGTTPSSAYRTTPSGAYRTTPSSAYTTTQTPTQSYSNSWNSTPTKLPETPNISFVKPKATIHSSVVNRPEASIRTPDKSHEAAAQKPKILPPSPFPTDFSQKKAINPETDKTSEQKSPFGLSSFSSQPSPSLTKSLASSAKTLPSVSIQPSPSLTKSLASSTKTLPSVSSQPSPSLTKSLASSAKKLPSVSMPPPPPVSSLSSSSFGTPPSSPKPRQPSTKPFLSLAPSNATNPNSKTAYNWVEKDASPIYAIPEDFKDLIKNDVVPRILKRPLSPSTYKDYFEALLYAEDFYLEKWDGFEMKNVTLKLEEASIYKRKGKHNKKNVDDEKDDKVFVTFELDSIPERRPFLLSRDFVSVSPSGTRSEPLQGLIYRVVNSNHVLVDFGEDFHVRHFSACKYNVKFSFNRVCLKRAHQAIATASDNLFRNFLFPDSISKNSLLTAQLPSIDSNLDWHQISAVRHILNHQNAVPYLVEGPIAIDNRSKSSNVLSRTGFVVCEAVLQVYRTSPSCRILICAATNKGCDVLTRRLRGKIPESNIFRANAAFRELDGVPEDILPSCLYKKERECFYCPSIHELRKYKVISSTFMSSFRLHNAGIMAGHFSHIFLVDASSVIEPEAMVALANLANESTVVTVTGAPGNHSGWIRSHIARENGLLISYFERLRESKLYESLDSKLCLVLIVARNIPDMNRYLFSGILLVGAGIWGLIIGSGDDQQEETQNRNSNRDNSSPNRATNPDNSSPNRATNPDNSSPNRATNPYNSSPNRATNPDNSSPNRATNPYNSSPNRATNPDNSSPIRATNPDNSSPNRATNPDNSSPNRATNPDYSSPNRATNPDNSSPNRATNPDNSSPNRATNPDNSSPNRATNPDNSSPNRATNPATEKTSAQKSPYDLSSESSNSSPKKATYHETDKTSAQKSSYGLSSVSSPKSHASSSKTLPSVSRPPPPPVSSLSSSSFGTPPSSPKPGRPSTKPILSVAPSSPTNPNSKTTYILVEKDASPIYAIPEDFKDLIKNDVVPGILKRPLSPSTYKDYFEALLYAEDFYLEKWDEFEMKNVTLKLEEASIYKRKGKHNKKNVDNEKDDKVFVTFDLDSIPERRPFLLSRDFVFVSPSGTRAEPLQGLIYRVVKRNRVLVDFGKDFHVQHYSACKYNVKFSFNRVCLKRAHQAVATTSDNLFRNFLFPDLISKNSLLTAQLPSIDSNLDCHQISAVRHILNHQNAVPYLVEGPITVGRSIVSSRTGYVVCEAVLQVYRTSPSCRILICAPTNKGCDVITRSLINGKIPESNIFRANAAFRELDGVPEDILPSCLYKKERECFSCPSIHELRKYKVISSTFMSSHQLHNEGITAGHFSHIFLVDASSVIEPEAMVALANLANESTVVTVTGAPGDHSGWIHSRMARQNGLLISYFERLRKSKLNIPEMSCFLAILRCIIGVDDNQEEETRLRNSNRYNSPYYDTPSRGYVPPTTTTTTNATTYGQIREPSGAYRTTPSGAYGTTPSSAYRTTPSGAYGTTPSSAYTTTQTPTQSYSNSWNSTPTKLPETPNISFVKPKATIHSSVVNRPEASIRTPDKSNEAAAQKPKILPPSPFPTNFSQKKAINPETDKTSEQKSPFGLSSFSFQPLPSLTKSLASSAKTLPSVSSQPSPSLTKSLASSAKTLPSVSSQPSPSLTKSLASSAKTLPSVSMPPPPLVSSLSSSSFGTPPSSPKPCRPSTKPFLSLAPSNSTNPNSKTAYILVEKDASPIYAIPEDFKDLIKNDVVPRILKRPLSPSTYKDYFEALLYAEDFYLERKGKHNKKNVDDEKDDKVFVAFELDSIPEKRPFLLSRDFVSVSPSGTRAEPLQKYALSVSYYPISATPLRQITPPD
ncbi:hypothetical protein RHGRI_012473 [Rhododendron griersonianum]|uniref:Helicase MOV-10-like beta-barrel domain-containing protein n=1 Tax=Rhododendron griersonianum TaxID=479676 RepID=A0AAV6KR43_9ERIC|nr:hypothetical protein RHGRI_012473 [Rhododendron griersonianum]